MCLYRIFPQQSLPMTLESGRRWFFALSSFLERKVFQSAYLFCSGVLHFYCLAR
ncbi:hypothetical protein BDV97DRAFT_349353 [Delphinella strobiligena]|nr:hypothetical protein BDV97DRAFT_349353 [Delphinella strobiligena]